VVEQQEATETLQDPADLKAVQAVAAVVVTAEAHCMVDQELKIKDIAVELQTVFIPHSLLVVVAVLVETLFVTLVKVVQVSQVQ
jgi:hypothetical protein